MINQDVKLRLLGISNCISNLIKKKKKKKKEKEKRLYFLEVDCTQVT
jgi:hypothetical protein